MYFNLESVNKSKTNAVLYNEFYYRYFTYFHLDHFYENVML
jgi:hypothetical protein